MVERGTGRKAAIGRPAAGKTGTAQEWRDAWFAGYTPQLAAAVWMGSPKGQESMVGVGGTNVTGGSFPAAIWGQFMGAAMASLEAKEFDPVDVAAWPPNDWIGGAPAVLPPGFVLPPHLAPPPPPPPEATTTTTTTTRPRDTTITTERRRRKGD